MVLEQLDILFTPLGHFRQSFVALFIRDTSQSGDIWEIDEVNIFRREWYITGGL